MDLQNGKTLATAAARAGITEKTARKYRRAGKLPEDLKQPHTWRTRADPFEEVWSELEQMLTLEPGLRANTLFEHLQTTRPGQFSDGQIRTLQRRIKSWKALFGKGKEVFFAQNHFAGELAESDFTHMTELGITISGVAHPHMLYHFVLTYSNWEAVSLCYSESYESLSEGFQNAAWELGGLPKSHRTDRMTAAVLQDWGDDESPFTVRYKALLEHYAIEGQKIQTRRPNENGDVEQSHYRLKQRVDQALMLRGSRDFASLVEYRSFLHRLIDRANEGRRERFEQEVKVLHALPPRRQESCKRVKMKVRSSSTIQVAHNTYSVCSRLIGEQIEVRLYANHLEIWHGQKKAEGDIARLRGESKHSINYRHVIDSLVRKPGAFLNYRYREDLYPTTRFRIAWDQLLCSDLARPEKHYLRILELAAKESESKVDMALRLLIDKEERITFDAVKKLTLSDGLELPGDVRIQPIDLCEYDTLLVEVG